MLRAAVILLTVLGSVQALAGLYLARAFAGRRALPSDAPLPAVTVLKPVCGDERLLEEALISFCLQDYAGLQIVIGAQDPADPALGVARRVKAMFPALDIAIVVDPTQHGTNGKIANLINMLPFARHEILVIADSDLHVQPDYLRRVVATLGQPGTGLVTTIAGGEAAVCGPAALLGATHITHSLLPGALLAVAAGRQDCLGGTMALTRRTLTQVGGLEMLADHVADDNLLGQLVGQLGLATRLADTLPVVTVQEQSLRAVWLHELRWARTIRSLAPVCYGLSVVQYPLFWTLLAVLVTGGAWWAIVCAASAWAVRAGVVRGIDHSLAARRARPARPTPVWLLPLRDIVSVLEIGFSYVGGAVVWRGRTMHVGKSTASYLPARPEAIAAIASDETLLSRGSPGLVPMVQTS
jgi:ceramide glucosyltransferase